MAEAIGLALGAIALLDPIYKGCQELCSAYQATSTFGVDYNLLVLRLRAEEFFFDRSLRYFHTYLKDYASRWRNEKSELRELVKTHMITILEVFSICYSIVRKYDANWDEGNTSPGKWLNQQVEKVKRLAGALGIGDGTPKRRFLAKRLDLQGAMKICRDRFKHDKQKKTTNGNQPEIECSPVSNSQQTLKPHPLSGAFQGRIQFVNGRLVTEQELPEDSGSSTEAPYLQAKAKLVQDEKKAQERCKTAKKIIWANHGKEDFEAIISTLNKLNKALSKLLPPLEFENNSLLVLRGPVAQPPTILKDTRRVRRGLEGLHKAIAATNQPSDGHCARFAVQLEDDHEDARLWMENSGLLNGLNQDSSCVFFGMMGSVGTGNVLVAEAADLIVAGTILRARQGKELKGFVEEILKLRSHKTNGKVEERVYQEIGDIEFAPDRIYSLRRVTAPGTAIQEQTCLEDMIQDAKKLTPRGRINLAAKIALSHIHFASVSLGPCPRQPSNYHFYQQLYDDDPDEGYCEANKPPLKTPWLDHKFGVPVALRKPGVLTSRTTATQQKVDSVQELGVFLYQLASGELLKPVNSQSELEVACQHAKESIDAVQDLCGLRVREIVELCLCYNTPKADDETNSTLALLQEVTYALQRCRHAIDVNNGAL